MLVRPAATFCLTLMTASPSRLSTLCASADEPLLEDWAMCDDGRVTGRLTDGTIIWMRPQTGSAPPTAGGSLFTSSGGRQYVMGAPRQEGTERGRSLLQRLDSMLDSNKPAVVVRRWLEGDEAPPEIAKALRERDAGFLRVAVFCALAAYALGI